MSADNVKAFVTDAMISADISALINFEPMFESDEKCVLAQESEMKHIKLLILASL